MTGFCSPKLYPEKREARVVCSHSRQLPNGAAVVIKGKHRSELIILEGEDAWRFQNGYVQVAVAGETFDDDDGYLIDFPGNIRLLVDRKRLTFIPDEVHGALSYDGVRTELEHLRSGLAEKDCLLQESLDEIRDVTEVLRGIFQREPPEAPIGDVRTPLGLARDVAMYVEECRATISRHVSTLSQRTATIQKYESLMRDICHDESVGVTSDLVADFRKALESIESHGLRSVFYDIAEKLGARVTWE